MPELDLIPDDYRVRLNQHAMLRRFAILSSPLIAVTVLSGIALGQVTNRVNEHAAELQTRNAITQQQQAQLQQMQDQYAEYQRQWALLRGLRAGAAVEDIFLIVDRAIVENDLWFDEWNFRRAGVIVDGQQRGVETGYFVIVASDGSTGPNANWQVETHMTINGQARDHQALSTFVRTLFEQPDIKDVNVRRTSLTNYAGGRAVDFDMTVILNSEFKES